MQDYKNVVLYHGTNSADRIKSEGFRIDEEAQEGSSFLGDNLVEGVHLSKSKEVFEEGGQMEDIMDVLEVSISAKNILKIDLRGFRELYKKYGISEMDPECSSKLSASLIKDGYEGIEYNDEIVVFDPAMVHLINN